MTSDEFRDYLHLMEKHRKAYAEQPDVPAEIRESCLAKLDSEIQYLREEVQKLPPMH